MHEVSPQQIAEIATRLLNELPGANHIPKTDVDARRLPSAAAELPASFADYRPSEFSIPRGPAAPGLSLPAPTEHVAGLSTLTGGMPSGGVAGFAPSSGMPHAGIPSPPSAPHGVAHTAPTSFDVPQLGDGSSHTLAAPRAPASGLPDQNDALAAFVRRVRTPHATTRDGSCALGEHDIWHQAFAGVKPSSTYASRPFDVAAIRSDFPVLHQLVHGKPLAWFDNAATTQKPQSVIDAISRFYAHDNSNIHRAAHTLAARSTDAYEQARQKVQAFLGASSAKEIIFVRGTTEGINLIAQTWGRKFLQPGDEIVMSTLEHHANIVPWQIIAREKGAIIRVIPVNDRGEVLLEEYQALLGPRTRLVSLTQASNSLGTILPVAEMTQMAKRYNARVLIDGAQSVAHIPVNMQQMGADFFVFSGHKIFGPTGIGAVYAKEEVQEIMPPWQGGGNMIRNVTFEETTFAEPPARFEAGTPNIADAVGLGAALDYVSQLGLPNIAAYEHSLLEYATEQMSRINGVRLVGTAREKVGVLSFVVPERKTEEVGKLLDLEGIAVRAGHHCSQPSLRRFGLESTVRPSLSLYNTKEEVDRLADAVRRIVRQ